MKKYIYIILILAIAVFGYFYFVKYKNQSKLQVQNQTQMQQNQTVGQYAPNTWKVWQDQYYSKATGKSYGYEISYPRDFDVYSGDQARGELIGTPMVTLSFPRDAFQTPKTNYGEAYLTISKTADTQNCFKIQNNNPTPFNQVVNINGIEFKEDHAIGVGAGNIYDSEVYRTIHENMCYEINLTVHTGRIENYPAGTVTEFNKNLALDVLKKMLGTFKFSDDQNS